MFLCVLAAKVFRLCGYSAITKFKICALNLINTLVSLMAVMIISMIINMINKCRLINISITWEKHESR